MSVEQIGDYEIVQLAWTIGVLRTQTAWRVREAGTEDCISDHDSREEAVNAVRRYQMIDDRRYDVAAEDAQRIADTRDGFNEE